MFPKGTSILIADDMAAVRTMVKTHLKAMGYAFIFEAGDGQECLKLLAQRRAEGHSMGLMILDWNMPNMSGLELVQFIRSNEEFKNVPVIFLTSETERDQVTKAIMSGVNQYIVKPFSPKTLEDKMKQVFNNLKQP